MQIVDLASMNYVRFLTRTSIMMKTITNNFKRLLLACTLFIASISVSSAADLPKLKIAVLGFGTALWELDTIKHYGLDIANGFDLVNSCNSLEVFLNFSNNSLFHLFA